MYVRSTCPWFLGLGGWSGLSWNTGKVTQPRSQVSGSQSALSPTTWQVFLSPQILAMPGSPAPSSGFLGSLPHFVELALKACVLKALTSPHIYLSFLPFSKCPHKSSLFVHNLQSPHSCCAWLWTQAAWGVRGLGFTVSVSTLQLSRQLAHTWKNLWLISHICTSHGLCLWSSPELSHSFPSLKCRVIPQELSK